MRTQVIALLLVAIIASAHCQSPIAQCLDDAYKLGQSIGEFVKAKQWTNIAAITGIISRLNSVISVCGPLITSLKSEQKGLQALDLNFNCISQMLQAIEKIKKLKGSFNAGLNFTAILPELASLGIDATQLQKACTK